MSTVSGRTCPLRYRYHPRTLRDWPETASQTLYVIGGLYGNLPALRAIEAMAAAEAGPLTLCFKGDFNWFNSDPAGFAAINAAVLRHDACQGNVEAELYAPGDEAGCGCAYPEAVDAGVVERSNAIHARLKQTAQLYPEILQQLETLPMVRRYRVGAATVGVVHGDAESLAGWRFDITALDDPANQDWLGHAFKQAGVDIFASSHTCLPVLRRFEVNRAEKLIVNNGAAGMPNLHGSQHGIITRIARTRSPHEALYGARLKTLYVDALAVCYDQSAWERDFLANWPAGSPAYESYFSRIHHGTEHAVAQAFQGSAIIATGGDISPSRRW